jgi:hypothetical protein
MDSITDWLWNLIVPLAKRVAVALGFGYVSFEGVSTALESAFSSIQSAFGGLLAEVAALLAMAGFFDAMSIMSGGILSGLAWMMLKKWAVVGTAA